MTKTRMQTPDARAAAPLTAAQRRRQTMTKVACSALAVAMLATIAVPLLAGL